MNRHDLTQLLARRCGLGLDQARRLVDALFSAKDGLIADALDRGDRVSIAGFGTFAVRPRRERTVKDPRTGAQRFVPATRAAVFRPGVSLRDRLR